MEYSTNIIKKSSKNLNSEQKIWRYMNFSKFMSLLQYNKLFFARADSFKDKFEEEIPEYILCKYYKNKDKIYQCFKEAKTSIFINCWSKLDNESYAMWHIYSRKYGIAIQSTVKKLYECVKSYEVDVKEVEYINYNDKNQFIDDDLSDNYKDSNYLMKKCFTFKPHYYEYEKEIRAIIVLEHEKPCLEVDVNLNNLIDEIIISPFADDWFIHMVKDLIKNKYGYKNIKVKDSRVEVKNY